MFDKPKRAQHLLAFTLAVGASALSPAVFAAAADDPAPFPRGPNALLVKQTCSQCHSPNVVVTQTFNEESARKTYQKMLGESPDTERGKKIVEYLSTVLGKKDHDCDG